MPYVCIVLKKSLPLIGCLLICTGYAWMQEPVVTGQKSPIITGITLNGDTLDSSRLKGGVVLVDFWASWNAPSRKHNLTTRKIYEKYRGLSIRKKRQFSVIQISLDTRRDLLNIAISKDALPWPSQLCDFKGWYSPYVSLFNVKKLPANFLIDTSGVIIATDVWGTDLEASVKKQME